MKNLMSHSNPKASVRALLTEIIDYAGLFPPAQLSMPEAVANYAAYKNNRYKWILGRFVVPVERLEEFAASAKNFFCRRRCLAFERFRQRGHLSNRSSNPGF